MNGFGQAVSNIVYGAGLLLALMLLPLAIIKIKSWMTPPSPAGIQNPPPAAAPPGPAAVAPAPQPAAAPGPAAAAPVANSTNWLKWGLGILALAALLWFIPWTWFTQAASSGGAAVSAPAATTEVGQLVQTLDWNVTTPGKTLAALVGPGWTNWILWILMVFIAYKIMRAMISVFRGGGAAGTASPKKSLNFTGGGILWLIFGLSLIGAVLYGINEWREDAKGTTVYKEVNLVRNQSEETEMTLTTSVVVKVRSVNISREGNKRVWVCTTVVSPTRLPFAVDIEATGGNYTNRLTMSITPASRQRLLENGTQVITVKFWQMVTHENECP